MTKDNITLQESDWTFISIDPIRGTLIIHTEPFSFSPIEVSYRVDVFDGEKWHEIQGYSDEMDAKKSADEWLKLGYIGGAYTGASWGWNNSPKVLRTRIVMKESMKDERRADGISSIIINPKYSGHICPSKKVEKVIS